MFLGYVLIIGMCNLGCSCVIVKDEGFIFVFIIVYEVVYVWVYLLGLGCFFMLEENNCILIK